MPRESQSDNVEPITLNVRKNTRNIIPKNTGSAVYLPVSMRSIFTLRLCSRLSWHFTTLMATTFSIKSYRISASAAFLSSFDSSSISTMQCSRSSSSFWLSSSWSSIFLSPSISFEAQNLGGMPARFAWSMMRWTTACIHLCTAESSEQKSVTTGFVLFRAVSTALSIRSEIPSPFAALTGITGMPSASLIIFTSIVPPLALTSSIMFKASTIGTRSSRSCKVRYRFRSMLVASTMFIMPSGFSFIM